MIDITKMDSGFYEVKMQNQNIVSIVENITLSVSDYAKAKSIELIFDTEVEEKIIACSPDCIERIMLNLLSNAVKFTDKGGSINVNMYDRQDQIQICVKDTGAGIPDGKLDIIFDRFRQVDKSLTRAHEGSGIGLSLVKSFVELHKGNISVSSKYGEGSEFIITLPVSTVPDDTENCDGSEAAALKSNVERINLEFSDVYGSWLS
jgi:two-component system CheB/CheR fusion protein